MSARPTMIAATTYERGMLSAGVRSICSMNEGKLAGISSRTKGRR